MRSKMAKSEEMVMIPKRKFERIVRLAREHSEDLVRTLRDLRRRRREIEERYREDKWRS